LPSPPSRRPPTTGYSDRATLPKLGAELPQTPVLLDTNVLINALAARGPPVLRTLLQNLERQFIAAPTLAELTWTLGRLDPHHPGTPRVQQAYRALLTRIEPTKVLVPTEANWRTAGELAGQAARTIAGTSRTPLTASDRAELVSDALTAILARTAGLVIITEDADFDILARLIPKLNVLFYDRVTTPA
jgi:predicted nucleic acid-binding protein